MVSRLSAFRGALLPVGLLILWEIASRAGLFSAVVLPPPSAVAARWFASLVLVTSGEGAPSLLGRQPHSEVCS